jgi:transposase
MQIHSVGIDLGKATFHLVALGAAGKVLVKKLTQKQLLAFTANMQTSLIGLEACSGAHFLGRALRKQGHDVRLIPAQFVKPFVKSNKNDFVDAEAIAEAVERTNMRFVPIKTDDQLDLQAIHRVRDRLISRRTAVINQLRAFLLERGMVFAQTPAKLKAAMADILENAEADLAPQMRNLIDMLWGEWKTVEQQIEELTTQLERISAADAGCTRIRQIPGIGPIVATAIVAAIGNGAAFRKGRDFAAWLGVVPRQYSTGGKAKLLGISKRGNVYLRKVLIHGARAAVLRIKRDRAPIGPWLDRLDSSAPKTSSWLRWRTSWHASHGPFYQVDKSTDHFRASQQRELSDSTTGNTATDLNLHTEVCTGTAKTKEQSQRRAFNLIPIMVSPTTDRLVRTGTQRNSSWPGETFSSQRPNTLPQTCLSLRACPLQSCGGPYIIGINQMPGCISDQGLCIWHAQALISFYLRRPVPMLHSLQILALLTVTSNRS